MESAELNPVLLPVAEGSVPEEQSVDEREEELDILKYLDRLEEVTARLFSRLVLYNKIL